MRFRSASLVTATCALLITACGPGPDQANATEDERQEFAFGGTVAAVDTARSIVSVANDEIPGWMMAMTMNYYVQPAEVLGTLEPGDRLSATVYSGDFQNLYEVEVVPDP